MHIFTAMKWLISLSHWTGAASLYLFFYTYCHLRHSVAVWGIVYIMLLYFLQDLSIH